ncbi:MAG TPA: FHA domain-containing serine/threonine-protein kinase [Gemmataceae bacterium]|nr:FHA domain-containing serine/threonine-protein kinase [Gemmataceae bacterium]
MPEKSSAADELTQVLADQKQRWAKCDYVIVEEYQIRHPQLLADSECLLDLIYNEICLREAAGDRVELAEYQRRFPELIEPLSLQWEVHQAIQTHADLAVTSIPGYELLEEIGAGGMGLVYEAHDQRFNRLVAIKVIRPELAGKPEVRRRFMTEATAMSGLRHPQIVQVYQVGETATGPFLVMELIQGLSLETLLKLGPLPIGRAIEILMAITEAVRFAHQKGIIHRDLKPANILIPDSPGESADSNRVPFAVKITDFGLAKVLAPSGKRQSSTQKGTLLGTPAYLPPEQLGDRKQTTSPANDVYSLGAILFAMLTGRPLYDEGNFVMTVLRVRAAKEPPALRPWRADVPEELEEICRKCLQRLPAARHQSAQALLDDLAKLAANSKRWPDREVAEAWLEPAEGGPAFAIRKLSTVMGRGKDCDVHVVNAEVSRRHCRILRFADKLFVEDLGSQHGIRVNGQRVSHAHLRDGDHFQLASNVFRVRCRYR